MPNIICSVYLDLQLFPLLGSALEFGLAGAPALTGFLKIGAWLSAEEINKNVIFLCRVPDVLHSGCSLISFTYFGLC